MANFSSKWQKAPSSSSEGISSRIKGSLKSNEPVRLRLEEASRQIQIHIARLEQSSAKLREKDTSLFSKLVLCIQKNDNARANMLANELSEVRKMTAVITQTKLALEQLNLRLSTVKEFGDLAATLAPTIGVIKNIRPGLTGLVPEAEREIGEVSSLLSGILVESGDLNPSYLNFDATSDDANKVLEEAEYIVEQKAKEKFPEVPIAEDLNIEAEAT